MWGKCTSWRPALEWHHHSVIVWGPLLLYNLLVQVSVFHPHALLCSTWCFTTWQHCRGLCCFPSSSSAMMRTVISQSIRAADGLNWRSFSVRIVEDKDRVVLLLSYYSHVRRLKCVIKCVLYFLFCLWSMRSKVFQMSVTHVEACVGTHIIQNTAQCSELFRVARHCYWNARSLNEQDAINTELSSFWYAGDTVASPPHKPQRRVTIRWSHCDLQLPLSKWRQTMTGLIHPATSKEDVSFLVLSRVRNLDAIFDCVSMFASLLNIDGKYSCFFATRSSRV